MAHDKEFAASASEIWLATNAALECLEWSEIDSETEMPLDSFGYFFTEDSRMQVHDEVQSFISDNSDDLHGMSYEQIGHDFILTRNHHGAGFWDRGLGERGERLTSAAHAYGGIRAYISGETTLDIE